MRYMSSREHVAKLNDTDVCSLLLSSAVERRVDNLMTQFGKLYDVPKKLQRADSTVQSARAYLDAVLKKCSSLSGRLDSEAGIAHGS